MSERRSFESEEEERAVSGWIDLTDQADGNPVLRQHLHRDDGRCLGIVVRYSSRALTDAWGKTRCGRYLEHIGVLANAQEARTAVERRLEEVGP
jgi:hypothetical protein